MRKFGRGLMRFSAQPKNHIGFAYCPSKSVCCKQPNTFLKRRSVAVRECCYKRNMLSLKPPFCSYLANPASASAPPEVERFYFIFNRFNRRLGAYEIGDILHLRCGGQRHVFNLKS